MEECLVNRIKVGGVQCVAVVIVLVVAAGADLCDEVAPRWHPSYAESVFGQLEEPGRPSLSQLASQLDLDVNESFRDQPVLMLNHLHLPGDASDVTSEMEGLQPSGGNGLGGVPPPLLLLREAVLIHVPVQDLEVLQQLFCG